MLTNSAHSMGHAGLHMSIFAQVTCVTVMRQSVDTAGVPALVIWGGVVYMTLAHTAALQDVLHTSSSIHSIANSHCLQLSGCQVLFKPSDTKLQHKLCMQANLIAVCVVSKLQDSVTLTVEGFPQSSHESL